MAEKLVCPICGEPTRIYMGKARKDRLCAKHADELKAGKLILNENGKFIPVNSIEKETKQQKTIEKRTECILCDNKTDGYLFCKECFKKYADKSILLKVINCQTIEFVQELNAHEDGTRYTCDDGHIVRSRAEALIDNWLYHQGIAHAYESALPIDEKEEHDLHPDFYLPEKNLYIEHWGFENSKDYKKKKDYKIQKYKEMGITVISTTETDINDINRALKRKLTYYKKGQVNE